jgi:ABC-type transporter Mla subunit MlaD
MCNDVTGIKTGSELKINGLVVGRVKHMELFNSKYVLIAVNIFDNYKIGKKSMFSVEPSDFMGNKFISIALSDSSQQYFLDGDTTYIKNEPAAVKDFGETGVDLDSITKVLKVEFDKVYH